MQKSILVIGGTGHLGRKVINQLVDKKINFYALLRKDSNIKELEYKGVKIIHGDITIPETITPALNDIDIALSTAIGYTGREKGDTLKNVDD